MSHDTTWTQPPALVSGASRLIPIPRMVFRAPAILRFTTDSFMEELLGILQTSPERLAEYRLRRETWRGFTPARVVEPPKPSSLVLQRLGLIRRGGVAAALAPPPFAAVPAETPLKLYQPAHQRHYLVAASLVCRVAGLPDREVETGRGEQIGCVIRRLLPPPGVTDTRPETWDEHAWVPGPQGYVWQRVGSDSLRVLDNEERLPLFTLRFAETERRRRRLFAGVIPVGRREAYLGAPRAAAGGAASGVTPRTARKVLLRKEVIEPWKALIRRADQANRSFSLPADPSDEDRLPTFDEKVERVKLERDHIQTASWYVLLDFAKYLSSYVKPVWRAVLDPSRAALAPSAGGMSQAEQDLFAALDRAELSDDLRQHLRHSTELTDGDSSNVIYSLPNVPASLRQALARFGTPSGELNTTLEQLLERVVFPYDRRSPERRAMWPSFLFPLADPELPGDAPLPDGSAASSLAGEERDEVALDENPAGGDPLERVDRLAVLVLRALRDDDPDPAPTPAVPIAAIAPANALEGWFVIRCVYDQPACAPLHTGVVSDPTEPFQMAGFFDPDAPARPIRIGLPIDTTPAGLRKFDKNTALVISDTLCGQIRRIRGLTLADLVLSVLPWPFHKDLPNLAGEGEPCRAAGDSLGMICSLSIPIVTICAFILLIIMVSLFDFIFKWLPYFIFCFPLPRLSAKPPQSPSS